MRLPPLIINIGDCFSGYNITWVTQCVVLRREMEDAAFEVAGSV